MKSTIGIALTTFMLLITSMTAAEGWMTDWEAAKAKAAAENKALLVDFTGSDWCGWCIKLSKEVFSQKEFSEYAAQKFVLVELDFPQQKAQDPKEKAQNEKLAQEYQIEGFPTIMLMDAKGRPFARTGYEAGGPEAYGKHLDGLMGNKVKFDAELAEAAKLEGPAKAGKILAALNVLSPDVLSFYKDEIDEIYKNDPSDTLGFKKKQGLLISLEKLNGDVAAQVNMGKADDGLKLVDTFIAENSLSGEDKQKALLAKINCFSPQNPDDLNKADMLMDEIIAIDPKTETGNQCAMIKQRITEMRQPAPAKVEPGQ
jgi:thiol-disulfide isomerase/thioredoxin